LLESFELRPVGVKADAEQTDPEIAFHKCVPAMVVGNLSCMLLLFPDQHHAPRLNRVPKPEWVNVINVNESRIIAYSGDVLSEEKASVPDNAK